ncbi:MAG: U32 family peptidase C-terminal domain-containing protein, partial [Clostridia bacterium]|nr:U32 family peptidase C-terminal domain-containing protein [Clostridia bacterium]
ARTEIEEDERGTYVLNSRDLKLISYISDIIDAGICSLKIEGRMKSEYYVATVINAYRRAIDGYYEAGEKYKENPLYQEELVKTAHRDFTTAYFFGENDRTVNYDDSQSKGSRKFIATVVEGTKDGYAVVEMRNRFKVGDELEVLSPSDSFNKIIKVGKMLDGDGEIIEDAKLVQQKIKLYTDVLLAEGDILRAENDEK